MRIVICAAIVALASFASAGELQTIKTHHDTIPVYGSDVDNPKSSFDGVNETVRPSIERLIAFRYYLAALVQELDNQQDPIANTADELGDGDGGTAPRTDAPTLTGTNVQALRDFAANMRDQITQAALDSLTEKAVRDVNTIIRSVS